MAADRRVRVTLRERIRGKAGGAGFVAAFAVLPLLAGCSGFTSSAPPAPAAYPPAAAAQPPYSPAVAGGAQQPYSPAPAQAGTAPMPPATQTAAAAPGAPPPAPKSFSDQVGDVLSMFRDPADTATTIDEARALPPRPTSIPGYPSQSITDWFKQDNAAAVAAQSTGQPSQSTSGAYPSQSISDLFKSNSAPQPQTAAPHPPSTYYPANGAPLPNQPAGATAGAPPYTPSSQQAAASAPAPAATDAAAGGPYPSQSLFDLFKKNSDGQ